ncbi:MAG TPA: TRAP transporter permease [Rectinemataceae bacterium]
MNWKNLFRKRKDPLKSNDADEILEDVEAEFNYRKKIEPFWMTVILVVSALFVGYHMVTAGIGIPEVYKHRSIHLGFLLVLCWLYFPARKGSPRGKPSAMDLALAVVSLAVTVLTVINRDAYLLRGGVLAIQDYVVGSIVMLLVLEATRRTVGGQMLWISIICLVYMWAGPYIPGVFSHRGLSVRRIIQAIYTGGEGIFGMPLGVSSTYLIIFVILAAILDKSGLGKLFNDLALGLGGRFSGGPAKVAVVASALTGTISGSAASNVATTGAFTIPLMKKIGYQANFAGAVEAAASTGGQIMPPIMGSAAFIMAEYLGIPYLTIAAAGIIPALFYFASVYFQVDFRAKNLGLRGLDKSEMPDVKKTVLRYGQMILPMVVLIWLMGQGRTPLFSAFYAVCLTVLLSWFRKETRILLPEAKAVAISSARTSVSIGISMAAAGFMIAAFASTGLGIVLADSIVAISKGSLIIVLILTMIVAIILGLGLPTSACYVITASICAPILIKVGLNPFLAHFFVFYFSCLSTVTPPIALAAYVAAGIANANTDKVGWAAFRLALAGFIVPFFFIYSPAMVLMGTDGAMLSAGFLSVVIAVVSGLVGTWFLAASIEGYLFIKYPTWLRVPLFAAAMLLIDPKLTTSLIGISIALLSILIILGIKRKRGNPAAGAAA